MNNIRCMKLKVEQQSQHTVSAIRNRNKSFTVRAEPLSLKHCGLVQKPELSEKMPQQDVYTSPSLFAAPWWPCWTVGSTHWSCWATYIRILTQKPRATDLIRASCFTSSTAYSSSQPEPLSCSCTRWPPPSWTAWWYTPSSAASWEGDVEAGTEILESGDSPAVIAVTVVIRDQVHHSAW